MTNDTDFLERGNVEPHAQLLKQPLDDQLLFKIMKFGDFLRSVEHRYLHLQRVDHYEDFPSADARDGEQLPLDRAANEKTKFQAAPNYSAADYFDSCRARTYASSFTLENSPLIWERYGTLDPLGKVGVVFNFGRLKAVLNETIGEEPGRSALMVGGTQCRQIFQINYGLINYVDASTFCANTERLPNPVQYSYMKDEKFAGEHELRITLSTLGFGNFALADGTVIAFPPSMQLSFDFRTAFQDGTIIRILCPDEEVLRRLAKELVRFKIRADIGA